MGATEVIDIFEKMDLNWFQLTYEGGYAKTFWIYTIVLVAVSFAAGFLARHAVGIFRNERRMEEERFVESLHSALKEKGCAEYYDLSCKQSIKDVADRLADIKNGQCESQESEQPEQHSGLFALTGDEALRYIANQPENIRKALRDVYEEGGAVEADAMDGMMQRLNSLGLISPPPLYSPYEDILWSITPDVNALLRDYPEVLDGESPDDLRKLKKLKGFSRCKARLVLKAFEADSMVEAGNDDIVVISSCQSGEGIFVAEAVTASGVRRTTGKYTITDGWRAFLRERAHIDAVRELANADGPTGRIQFIDE